MAPRANRKGRLAAAVAALPLVAGCGAVAAGASRPAPSRQPASLIAWPQFGLNPQRSDATNLSGGFTVAALSHLRRITVALPGTIDSSPAVVGGVLADGRRRTVVIATSTYGRTFAIDADSGRILWTYTPPDFTRYAGSAQITNSSPVVAGDEPYVYAPDPDGKIRKLSLANGSEVGGGWPVTVTRDPSREKLSSALGAVGPYLLVTTGGYYGDIPPYQGHLVVVRRATGSIVAVFNALCANVRHLLAPASCPTSDAAIWSRAGAVVEEGDRRVVVATGNGPFDGRGDWGDSGLELSLPRLRLLGTFTPRSQLHLDRADLDFGSGGPALLSRRELLFGSKDGYLRVVSLAAMGRRRGRVGGELPRLPTPGNAELLSQPCVWRHNGRTTVFIADSAATAAYALRAGRLVKLWENHRPGTSPIYVGGLLYVYSPSGGGIAVYRPFSPRPLRVLPAGPGHFNSPALADGVLAQGTGNGNDHSLRGTLELYVTH